MSNDIEAIERATLDAVAPAKVLIHGDWLVPIDQTTIGRATSAVPLRHKQLPVSDIEAVEKLFKENNKVARFRVADVASLASIGQHLDGQGYQPYQPTLTQTINLQDLTGISQIIPGYKVLTSNEATPSWRSIYLSEDFDPVDGANRVRALSRSRFITYVWVMSDHGPLAAGTLSMSHQWLGFHGIRTLRVARGRGLAGLMMSKMAEIGISEGCSRAYLQVDEGNQSAVSLYRKLGFRTSWRYHYWGKLNDQHI